MPYFVNNPTHWLSARRRPAPWHSNLLIRSPKKTCWKSRELTTAWRGAPKIIPSWRERKKVATDARLRAAAGGLVPRDTMAASTTNVTPPAAALRSGTIGGFYLLLITRIRDSTDLHSSANLA